MTITMTRAASTQTTVPLTSHHLHTHKPSPIEPGFGPPQPAPSIKFTPLALAAAIARATTLLPAPPEILLEWRNIALMQVRQLIKPSDTFELTEWVNVLADARRTDIASSVGAGITDLFMNAVGYVWRDNAKMLGSVREPHPDYIYGGGAASLYGVVLAEAFGSFAADLKAARIKRKAQEKYLRQVKPHLGKLSIHGRVVHGYSVAFGSRPDTAGSFLSVSETRVPAKAPLPKPSGPNPVAPGVSDAVPSSLALSTHRSNFLLMGAVGIADWTDRVRGRAGPPLQSDGVLFRREEIDGRMFLRVAGRGGSFHDPQVQKTVAVARDGFEIAVKGQVAGFPSFVIEENAADLFLGELSQMIADGLPLRRSELILPTFRPVGMYSGGDDRAGELTDKAPYAFFADGLALRDSEASRPTLGFRIWHPKDGLGPMAQFG